MVGRSDFVSDATSAREMLRVDEEEGRREGGGEGRGGGSWVSWERRRSG